MKGTIGMVIISVLLAHSGCTGKDWSIGALAGDYEVLNWYPGCVVHVSGSKVTADCVYSGSDSSVSWTDTWTLDFTFSEDTVSGTESSSWSETWEGDTYTGGRTRTVSANKTSSGSGSGPFGPFAGTWSVSVVEQATSEGEVFDSRGYNLTADISGNAAMFTSTGGGSCTVVYTDGHLAATGDVTFAALH